MAYDYDFYCIGAGSGGVRASRFAAGFGARVAVAESGAFGGTCVNVGCIPKKLFSYAAHFAEDFHEAQGYGWSPAKPAFNWRTLVANKDTEIARLNGIYERILANNKVTIHRGRATVIDAHTVEVDGKHHTSAHILVATGGQPMVPTITGAEHAITSNEAFYLDRLPARAIVVGGGYIAVEFASIFNGLGVDTTLVYRGERLIRHFDHDLGTHLAKEMIAKGVKIRFGTDIASIAKGAGDAGALSATLTSGEALDTGLVMFATGRTPNTAGLGLGQAGVKLAANGAVIVDGQFVTNVPSIHAIGDCIDRIQLTPVALAEGMVVAARLFSRGERSMHYDNIPTAVFSHPNVATVGLSEEQARRTHEVAIFRSTFTPLKQTMTGFNQKMLMKLVVDKKTDRVLGAHMVGADAGEIIQGFAVALQCGATKAQFDATIGIHPSAAEEFVTMRDPVA